VETAIIMLKVMNIKKSMTMILNNMKRNLKRKNYRLKLNLLSLTKRSRLVYNLTWFQMD